MHNSIASVEMVLLLLLAFVTVFALLARKLETPYPIVLVIAGLIVGLIPGMPRVALNPDVVFVVFLPPLLYAAAWQTSWRDFRYNLVSIGMLAFGLVGFLVIGVGFILPKLIPAFDARTGLVLGAVVATTDAIAATSIARRLGLPSSIVDILEGESLINDATGLLALEFGTGLIVAGHTPSFTDGALRLTWLIVGGIAVGLFVGWVVDWLERFVDDAPIEITLGLLVPYTAYLAAEGIKASGVLATVACGLWLSRRSAHFFSASVRLQAWGVWEALTFVLNGLVFVLIGLQLPTVIAGLQRYSWWTLGIWGFSFSALLIALRLAWIFPGAKWAHWIRTRILHQRRRAPNSREIFVVGWIGMRGVVSLAAALALPITLADGTPFPHRDLILFLTFSSIVVTLVLQGLTLPAVIRYLGLAGVSGPNCEEKEARDIMLSAALNHLHQARDTDEQVFRAVYDDLIHHYRHKLAVVRGDGKEEDGTSDAHHARHQTLTHEVIRLERSVVIGLRNEGRINDEVLRRLERQLDLSEARLFSEAE